METGPMVAGDIKKYEIAHFISHYCKISDIRRTKTQNLNDFPLVLRSSLSNPLKPGVKSRMKM